jgi:hypothetical protein
VRLVDIRLLKRWVVRHLGQDSRLREVVLLEPDILGAEDYVSKLGVWLKLYDLES